MVALSPSVKTFLTSPFPLMGAWILAGILTVIVPISKWKKQSKQYYQYYGKYVEYENNQRAYEEGQNQDGNQYNYNNGNNNNNNNNQNGEYDRDGNWYPSCSWWQVKCRQRVFQMKQYNDGGDNQVYFPDWYATIGGVADGEDGDREEGASSDQATGALKFIYAWTLIMWVTLLVFGAVTIFKRKSVAPLMVTMLIVGQFALLQLLMVGQGVLATEGREIEESVYGWYGQLGVLMVYSDWAYFLFSVGFTALLTAKIIFDKYLLKAEAKAAAGTSASTEVEGPAVYKSMA